MSEAAADPRDVLRRALVEIRSLKERLAAAERARAAEPVAIIGMGCRFAGGADNPDALWRLLTEGRDAIGCRPPGRWAGRDADAPDNGGFLPDVEGFDSRFFEIAPREAAAMDPQHRLLLEVAWEALENAAINPQTLAGSRTGVFVGLATHDFARRVPTEQADRYFGVGTSPAVASGRMAYLLDLRGPCVTLDTACSSSLVAVHYALRALRDGDCDTALAGGVSLMLGPELGRSFVAAGMLAPDGRCKSFDAAADGYGRGEGCGVVVLRRLSDALRNGDPVLAVLRGSAVNQDGRSAGLTAPNGPAQTAVIRAALQDAGLQPADIDYVEAHGTGTPLGDPIEWHALAAAFIGRDRPLRIGSVKTHLGHTEAAAGVAGLIRTVLMLQHGRIVPGLHFKRLNPAISRGTTPLEMVEQVAGPIRSAGISSFGFSGTNAHVVIEAAPERATPAASGDGVLLLSAKDPDALRDLAARYAALFAGGADFLAACHTAATGRARFPWWIAVRSPAALRDAVPSDAPMPALGETTGPRITLPTYPFQREHFPLPGAAPAERVLRPDDPVLAGTGGLAHLGVLLGLIEQNDKGTTLSLRDVSFAAPLRVMAARRVRVTRADGRIMLETRGNGDTDWTQHLTGAVAARPPSPWPVEVAAAMVPADSLYDRIAASGFRYGPEARCLDRIAASGQAVVGTLSQDDDRGWRPGAIEAAAQLVYALLPPDSPPVMLSGAAAIALYSGGPPARAWIQVDGPARGPEFAATFGLSDTHGRVVFAVLGARFAPLPDLGRRWSRLVTWEPAPLPAQAGHAEPATMWIASEGSAQTLCGQLLSELQRSGQGPLHIVTRGAQVIGTEASQPALGQSALWGLAQAIMAERPAFRCRLIDLDPDLPLDAQQGWLVTEATACDEPAISWRGGRRLARRLEPPQASGPAPVLTAAGQSLPPDASGAAASVPAPGIVRWEPRAAASPSPGAVRLRPIAAGLTFRDRLLFNGLAPANSPFGSDCAGIVDAVGPGVTDLEPGDRVIAVAAGAIADSIIVPAERVAPAPTPDLLAASTMPVPYLTALAALPALSRDDVVLIHQAGSATGLAALRVAQRAGARVLLTASKPRHAWLAAEQPVDILDSRAPETWGAAIRGVTVAFGAFDDAHRAVLDGTRVVNLNKAAADHFDLDKIDPWILRPLMTDLAEYPPLPRRIVARGSLAGALAGDGPLVGRIVVLLRDPPPVCVTPGATYLVTGAAGSLGQLVAGWIAAGGGRLCLVDRAPVHAAAGHQAVQADIGDEVAITALFERLAADPSPLRGIFHCAAVTDDDLLDQLMPGRLDGVLRAKAGGGLLLDHLSRHFCQGERQLHQFVLFSSIVSLLPSARQGAYAAANAVLDQIAQARHARGLPALSLNWGPWAAGIGQEMGARAAEAWAGFGVQPILPAAGLRALPGLLASPEPQRIAADMAWDVYAAARQPATEDKARRREPGPVTVERLQDVLAPLLGVRDPRELDGETPLTSFGFDSLTAVEFARALSRDLGRPVAPDFAYNHPTLAQAAAALTRAPSGPRVATRFRVSVPRWEDHPSAMGASGTWTVAGDGKLATELRAALPPVSDPANLVVVAPGAAPDPLVRERCGMRDAFFSTLLPQLRARAGMPARIVLLLADRSPLADEAEAFATALAAEQPCWTLRTVRVDGNGAASIAPVLRELAAVDTAVRVRLAPGGRRLMRLRPAPPPGRPWQPSPDGTYLVTGGSGGVGALVAARLVARGARHVALASRNPVLPSALAGVRAEVTLHPVDLTEEAAVAALLRNVAESPRPLHGVFHTAGITADGRVADAGWDRLGRAFPAKTDAAFLLDQMTRSVPLSDFVLFSSTTAWFGLPGTAGYAAANGGLHAVAQLRHEAGFPAKCIAWCAWQGVGMAADPALWMDGRAPSLPAETALAAFDAAMATDEVHLVVTEPEWQAATAPEPSLPIAARGG